MSAPADLPDLPRQLRKSMSDVGLQRFDLARRHSRFLARFALLQRAIWAGKL